MAKSSRAVVLLASALCFLSLLGPARCEELSVEGQVFCDTCRTRFVTRLSEYMEGARVRLECRDREGGQLTYSKEGLTEASGAYRLEVEGEHEEEVCEVVLVKSSRDNCKEFPDTGFGRHSARVSLTNNNGIATSKRLANPLGFFKDEALPECEEALRELGILPTDLHN